MIHFITGNAGTYEEVETLMARLPKPLVGRELVQVKLDLPEIQDFQPCNVLNTKLIEGQKRFPDQIVMVEASGLFLWPLLNFPGALFNMYLEIGLEEICRRNAGFEAEAVMKFGYWDPEIGRKIGHKSLMGTIASEPRGTGFGWDTIFIPCGYEKTLGQMSREEKEKYRLSMRMEALIKLTDQLGRMEDVV